MADPQDPSNMTTAQWLRNEEDIMAHDDDTIPVSKKFLKQLRDDLHMRGEPDSDGIWVINLSGFLWRKLDELVNPATQEE